MYLVGLVLGAFLACIRIVTHVVRIGVLGDSAPLLSRILLPDQLFLQVRHGWLLREGGVG